MKKILLSVSTIIMVFVLFTMSFAATKKKYYAKFMSFDYGNWIWEEITNVTSCQKTADGLQYIIKYRGIPEPRMKNNALRSNSANSDTLKERDLTMTIGVDNVIIYEYEE